MSDFYATSAQVLPVLLLALLFDGRLLQQARRATGLGRALAACFIGAPTLATAIGEMTALSVLADGGHGSAAAKYTVMVAVVVTLSCLLAEIFVQLLLEPTDGAAD